MTDGAFQLSRRALLAGLGLSVLEPLTGPAQPATAPRRMLNLRAREAPLALRPGQPDTLVWGLEADGSDAGQALRRGDKITVAFRNDLPVPAVLNWHGTDGNPGAEPLTGRPPVSPGGTDSFDLTLKHAGTSLCDVRLLGDGQARPSATWPLIVHETEPVIVDREQVLLIEDWRLDEAGRALVPGTDATTATTIYTCNGGRPPELTLRRNERVRLRFINGGQRNVIAIKIADLNVPVLTIDGQPAEPFLARNGQLVLAPGSRIDVVIDATAAAGSATPITLHDGTQPQPIAQLVISDQPPVRSAPLAPPDPLPSNGLPDQLDLKNALRTELVFDRTPNIPAGWIAPSAYTPYLQPAFRVQRNRTVVAALVNRSTAPVTFHLHGHHFRLLDRLDDGWKPFWLDTLVVDALQTQRIAFLAETPGRWLMQAMAADWAAPRLIQIYEIT